MRARLHGLLRVGALLLLLGLGSAGWLLQRAAAEVSERALGVGRQLDQAQQIGRGLSTLRLNGQVMSLSSVSSDLPVGALLDRFAGLCARGSAAAEAQLAQLTASGAQLPVWAEPGHFGVLREQHGQSEGVAACFAGAAERGLLDFAQRLLRAAETGDLAALGQLRYVFARRTDAGSTHVISVWTHAGLPVEAMFPERGDAPGRDLFDGARPEGARRIISAELMASEHHTAIYETQVEPWRALTGFDAPLRAAGFAVGDLSRISNLSPVPTRIYLRPDATVVVLAARTADTVTTVSAFRLAQGGFVALRR